MGLLYQLAIEVYLLGVRIAALFNTKARKWVFGRANRSTLLYPELAKFKGAVWMHCASVGEFEQGRPVFEALRDRYPDRPFVVSFFSPSGYEALSTFKGADTVFYLPPDRRSDARALLEALRPCAVLWIKYEFWFNHLNEIYARQIPLFLISAIFRPSQHFFSAYGGWFRKHLSAFTCIFVQDEHSANLLAAFDLTAEPVGDTRFDRVVRIAATPTDLPLIERFCTGHKVVVAGSTWPADEAMIAEAMPSTPNAHYLIVPHETHEGHITELCRRFSNEAVRYSQCEATGSIPAGCRVLIIDRLGLLAGVYRHASVALIGGGFGAGIHNITEAAVYGIPVVFGPNYSKFREAHDLLAAGGAFTFSDSSTLSELLISLLNDDLARSASGRQAALYIQQGSGATTTIVARITDHIYPT